MPLKHIISGVVLLMVFSLEIFAQNKYQYLFSPDTSCINKIEKQYKIIEGDTVLASVFNYNSNGLMSSSINYFFKSETNIEYQESTTRVSYLRYGGIISVENIINHGDSVLIIELDDTEGEYLNGVLYFDSLNNIIAQTRGGDTISTHQFEDGKFIRSRFMRRDSTEMIVSRTYFDDDSYAEKALDDGILIIYSTLVRVDERTVVNILEMKLDDGNYYVQKFHKYRGDKVVVRSVFNEDSGLLEVFQIDSISYK